jgi:hypothetical protein
MKKTPDRFTSITTRALKATLTLHQQLLGDDEIWGYEGTLDQFQELLAGLQSLSLDYEDFDAHDLVDIWYGSPYCEDMTAAGR